MELKETIELMKSDDYKKRLLAEYYQTKIRYEKLRLFNNRIKAAKISHTKEPSHNCPNKLLIEQQKVMEKYLEILEVRMSIEGLTQ